MGRGTWDGASRDSYRSYASSTVGKSTDEIYRSRTMDESLNPFGVTRESRDSAENPQSTPVIIGLDVTGSMGMLADTIARSGLGVAFEQLLDKKPVTDPHLMFMGIGDANWDQAPLQVSQFEGDASIIEQVSKLYIEHGGGGNHFESYNLPWYFAAARTVTDAHEKRGKKGYLFTCGDEEAPDPLTADQVKRFIGDEVQGNISSEDLLRMASEKYNCFHIIIEEGSYARSRLSNVRNSWNDLMGQHVVGLSDHTKLAETIVSIIQIAEGHSDVAAGWGDSKTQEVIAHATKNLPRPSATA
jgi:hypothetical protein